MKKKALGILLIGVSLTSCTLSTSLEFKPYEYKVDRSVSDKRIEEDLDNDIYKRQREYGEITLPTISNGLTKIDSLKTLSTSKDQKYIFDNEGELRLLVVPLCFADEKHENLDEKRTIIQNAFFGDSSKTSYESVASYYDKSSYGKAKIKGEVTPWIESELSLKRVDELLNQYGGVGENVSRYIAAEVADRLHELDELGQIDLSQYDQDNDDNIDGIYIVYDRPQDQENGSSSLFWAYFDKVTKNYESMNEAKPYASSYSWSSFYFTGESSLKTHIPETNTYIHETGHLFGLDDYYNTNGKSFNRAGEYLIDYSGVFQPTGFMDMMDYNLGDHNAFSKYLLNWVSPKVLLKEGKVTLSSFTKTGDCILIPAYKNGEALWNGTPFDEYLLLEYFTPDELNDSFTFATYSYFDGLNEERVYSYPVRHGLRVYHVDARLAYFNTKITTSDKCWLEANNISSWMSSHSGRYVDFLNTNSTLGPVDKSANVLLNLLEADGEDRLYRGEAARDESLFGLFSSFGYNTYQDFVFNKTDKENNPISLPFKFKVSHLDSYEITLTFESNKK